MMDGQALAERHPADLLGRPLRGQPPAEAARWLQGRRVVITGAGGSVGQPLAAAVAAAGPAALSLLDHHEASLWELHRRFGQRPEVSLVLADVRHRERLAEVLRAAAPTVLFHLAAYKHVPFGELFSGEVFGVNVLGTRNVLELAAKLEVERLVYPSSDKACNPPSLYGATKRVAETLVRQAALASGRRFTIARFVNILGTRGSVIETFAQQVQAGRPLTVTDAAMTRYWIAMDEALWLLLSTAELAAGGQTLLVDPGAEIAVVDIARRICGLLRGPNGPCELRFSQPRPGERLREELHSRGEQLIDGPRPGLLQVLDLEAEQHLARLPALLDGLVAAGQAGPERLKAATMAAALELQ